MGRFADAVARHIQTIPEGSVQAEHRLRLEVEWQGCRWPIFARWRLARMAARGEIRRGPDTRSVFHSGRGLRTWGPMPGNGRRSDPVLAAAENLAAAIEASMTFEGGGNILDALESFRAAQRAAARGR